MFSQYNQKSASDWLGYLNKDKKAKELIQKSIDKSLLFSGYTLTDYENMLSTIEYYGTDTKVVLSTDSVSSAVMNACYMTTAKACVLNFASYIKPGGDFLKGAMAQEEFLCHTSGLYPILMHFEDDYKERRGTCRNGAYQDTGIYSEDVPFYVNGKHANCDVLTFSAVNFRVPMWKANGSQVSALLEAVMRNRQRIAYILPRIFGRCDEVILGAWGCGIFKNNPYNIASGWKECMELYPGLYKKVYHPIFKGGSNFKIFKSVFEK